MLSKSTSHVLPRGKVANSKCESKNILTFSIHEFVISDRQTNEQTES